MHARRDPSTAGAAPPPSDGAAREHMALGIFFRIVAMASMSALGALLKLASERGVSTFELVFYRSLFAMPLVLAWTLLGPGLAAVRTKRPGAHATRAVVGLVSMALGFQAYVMLPLAEATTIGFSAPLIATVLSAIVLGETVGRHRWLAILVGFLGVLIVMRPGGAHFASAGTLVALASAFGVASVYVTVRQLGTTENATATVFWFTLASLAITAVPMIWWAQAHDPVTWALVIAMGLTGGVVQLANTQSLRLAPVSALAPFDYTQLFWAALFGWLFWDAAPVLATYAGAALIIASGLYVAYSEHRRRLPVAVAPPLSE